VVILVDLLRAILVVLLLAIRVDLLLVIRAFLLQVIPVDLLLVIHHKVDPLLVIRVDLLLVILVGLLLVILHKVVLHPDTVVKNEMPRTFVSGAGEPSTPKPLDRTPLSQKTKNSFTAWVTVPHPPSLFQTFTPKPRMRRQSSNSLHNSSDKGVSLA